MADKDKRPPAPVAAPWLTPVYNTLFGLADLVRGATVGSRGYPDTPWAKAGEIAAAVPFGVGSLKSLKTVVTGAKDAQAARTGIRAYHGSPHDFEKFDASKTGTGEGAQAYGHGLYFAEQEATAGVYRDALANPEVLVGGKPVRFPQWSANLPPEDRLIRRIGDKRSADPKASDADIVAQVRAELAREGDVKFGNWPSDTQLATTHEQLRLLDEWSKQGISARKGRMYEVNINADPAHFLDWDAPLSAQPEQVRRLMEQEFRNVQPVKVKDGWYSVTRVGSDGIGRTMTQDILESSPEAAMQRFTEYMQSESGRHIYERLADSADAGRRGSMPYVERTVAASNTLRKAGVPGIRYLDQGSRAAGEGSRNIVMFPGTENLIDLLRKYGWLPPIAGLTALSQMGQPRAPEAR